MEKIVIIGSDLAKSVFQVHAVTESGHVVVRRALRRSQVLEFFRNIEFISAPRLTPPNASNVDPVASRNYADETMCWAA